MPPPFGPIDKESIPSLLKRKRDDLLASDESELEEDDDHNDEMKLQEEKVKQARLGRIAAEKQKLAIATTTATTSAPTTIHSNTNKSTPKIKIKIGKPPQDKPAQDKPAQDKPAQDKPAQNKPAEDEPPQDKPLQDEPPQEPTLPTLTDEQKSIRDKCLSMEELKNLPAFKNYVCGSPTKKLYVKNLSKQVSEQDLIELYNKFSPDIKVNLMKKGRLRDQAFVEFPNEEQASLALTCTNGYMLMDRPMAVLYGKSA